MSNVTTAAQIRNFLSYKQAAVTDSVNGPMEYSQDRYEQTSDAMALSITGALSTTVTAVKATAGKVYWIIVESGTAISATTTAATLSVYVQLFNATTGNVTLATTSPDMVVWCPANGTASVRVDTGGDATLFATAISIAATTTGKGNTAPATVNMPNVTVKYA